MAITSIIDQMSNYYRQVSIGTTATPTAIVRMVAIGSAILIGTRIAFSKPLVTAVPLLTLLLSISAYAYYYPEKILDKIMQVKDQIMKTTT